MLKYLSFNQRIVFSFLALSFLGMGVSGVLVYRQADIIVTDLTMADLRSQLSSLKNVVSITQAENVERIRENAQRLSGKHLKRFHIDTSISTSEMVVNQESQAKSEISVPRVFLDGSPLQNHSFVDQILGETGHVATVFVRTDSGFVRVSTSIKKEDGTRAVLSYIPLDAEVSRSLSSGTSFYGRAKILSDWYITAYEPIKDAKGRVLGALFFGSKDTTYEKLRDQLREQRLLKSGYYFILSSKGVMLLHPVLEGKNVVGETALDGQKIFQDMVNHKAGTLNYRWLNAETKQAQNKTAFFEEFPALDWIVAASLNTSEIDEHVYALRSIIAWTMSLSLACMAVLIALLSHSISKSLGHISTQIQSSTASVSSQAGLMSKSAIILAEASTQQAAAVQETAATIDEISAMVAKNLESAGEAKLSSEQTQAVTDEGHRTMKNLEASVERMSTRNEETQQRVRESYEEIFGIIAMVRDVESKIKVINDIVFQTKLLSFNAAVEAARAGEQGKGFAIVAAEVGNLAQMTGNSAQEITQAVSSMVTRIESIISTANKSVDQIFAQAKLDTKECVESASECAQVLSRIKENTNNLHRNISEVAAASLEQSEGVRQLATAMHEIDAATQQNDSLAASSQENSRDLSTHATALDEAIHDLIELRDGVRSKSSGAKIVPFPERSSGAFRTSA